MTEVIDRLWGQIEPIVYITRGQFERVLTDWEIEPVAVNGELAFAALVKGPEFHFASFDTGAPITRGMIRSRLEPIMKRHGFVATRTPKTGADRQHRFNRAFGFQVFGEDEFFTHYRLERACQ